MTTESAEPDVQTNKDSSQTNLRSSLADTDNALVAAVDSVKKLVKKGNKFTEGVF